MRQRDKFYDKNCEGYECEKGIVLNFKIESNVDYTIYIQAYI